MSAFEPADSRIRLIRFACGSNGVAQALEEFIQGGGGYAVATSPALLRQLINYCSAHLDSEKIEPIEMSTAVQHGLRLKDVEPMSQAASSLLDAAFFGACRQTRESNGFGAVNEMPGFHKNASAVWNDLISHGAYDGEDLLVAAGGLGVLEERVNGLVEIKEAATSSLNRLNRDLNGNIIRDFLAAPKIDGNNYCRWFAVLGENATPLDAEFFFNLHECGAEVWILRDNAAALCGMGDPIAEVFDEEQWEDWGESASLAHLFDSGEEKISTKLQVIAAPDLLAEAEAAVRAARESAKSGFSTAIFVRDLSKYGTLLDSAGRRLNVKLGLPRKQFLASMPNIAYFLNLLKALASGNPRRLIGLINSGYAGVESGKRHEIIDFLNQKSKVTEDMDEASSEIPDSWLARILKWGEECKGFRGSKREWLAHFKQLGVTAWESDFDHPQDELTEREERSKAKLLSVLANDASIELLETHDLISLHQAVDWVQRLCERSEMTHPWNLEGIPVWDEASAMSSFDHLIILGVTEGTFPRKSLEDSVLNDQQREELSEKLGLVVGIPTSRFEAEQERQKFVRIISAAKSKLTLCYAQSENDRPQFPARYLELIKGKVEECETVAVNRSKGSIQESLDMVEYEAQLLGSMETQPRGHIRLDDLNASLQNQLLPRAKGPWGGGQIQRASNCHFQSFAADILNLRAATPHSRYYQLFELPSRLGLMNFEEKELAETKLREGLNTQLLAWEGVAPGWEIEMLRVAGNQFIGGWVEREFAARQIWRAQATGLETPFSFQSNRTQGVKGRATGKYVLGERLVIVAHEDREIWDFELKWESTRALALMLLSYGAGSDLLEHRPDGFAVEIDYALNNKKVLLTSPRLGLPGNLTENLFVKSIDWEEVKKAMSGSMTKVKEWSTELPIKATSGDHCTACSYGELCRAHVDYGDVN